MNRYCSGFKHALNLDTRLSNKSDVFHQNDVCMLIKASILSFKRATLDCMNYGGSARDPSAVRLYANQCK